MKDKWGKDRFISERIRKRVTVLLAFFVVLSTSYAMIKPGETLNRGPAEGFVFFEGESTAEPELINAQELIDEEMAKESAVPVETEEPQPAEETPLETELPADDTTVYTTPEPTSTPAAIVEPVFTENPVIAAEETSDPETTTVLPEETETPEPTADDVEEETPDPEETPEAEESEASIIYDDWMPVKTADEKFGVQVKLQEDSLIPEDGKIELITLDEDYEDYSEYRDKAIEAVANEYDIDAEQLNVLDIFDLSFYDKEGTLIQPSNSSKVKVNFDQYTDEEKLHVVHFKGSTVKKEEQPLEEEPVSVKKQSKKNNMSVEVQAKAINAETDNIEILEFESEEDGTVTFETESFSVYVVVESETPRLTVNFKNGSTNIASMIIKAADTADEVDSIIYDPGAGSLAEGEVFRGWTTDQNYTAESDLLTIDDVREAAMASAAALTNSDSSVTYYAAIYKTHTITYLSDDEEPITVGTASVDYPNYEAGEVSYTVNMGYTVDGSHNFEGWVPDTASQSNIKNYPEGAASETTTDGTVYYYENTKTITITGDVTFIVRAPEGNWLVFDENGKGATYTAPQFVLKGDVTKTPSTLDSMARNGYTFGGWYKLNDGVDIDAVSKDSNGYYVIDDEHFSSFTFGQVLSSNTIIYAKWTPKTNASYTVLVWKQNIAGNGYDFVESRILDGAVGQEISTVVQQGSGDNAYAVIDGTGLQYTGFHLKEFDKNVEIVPEGTSVVNVYYDRNIYTLTFEVQGSGYRYTRNDDNGTWGYINDTWVELGTQVVDTTTRTEYYLAQTEGASYNNRYTGTVYKHNEFYGIEWYDEENNPTYPNTYYRRTGNIGNRRYYELYWCSREVQEDVIGYTYVDTDGQTKIYTGPRFTRTQVNNNGWSTIKAISALYEQNISEYFPIVGTNGTTYTDSRWDPQSDTPYNQVLVYIDVMPAANVTFHENKANYPTKHMYYYVEALEDETGETRSYNGKDFVLYKQLDANYNFFTEAEDYIDLVGFAKSNSYPPQAFNANGNALSNVWNNSNAIYVYTYYLRSKYQINYMDGVYVDGDNKVIQHHENNQLDTSEWIYYDASLEEYDIVPDLPNGEAGYVFEGWYMDEACQHEYDFNTTMPVGGVTLYAKWRQIQYRVFLYTGVPEDDGSNLYWGSDNQGLSFRVSYGDKVSTPTGTRNGYKFLGWYTDPSFKTVYNSSAYVLNDETVTKPYDKTTTMTDPENRPWSGPWETGNGTRNSDITGWNGSDRYWVTRQLDLYANWSKILDGAEGINVVYEANGYATENGETVTVAGSSAPTDNATYLDSTHVVAGAAAIAPVGYVFNHWVVATWDGEAYTYDENSTTVLPGGTFIISAEDAKVVDIGNDKKKYTVQLIAIYKLVEEATPTHIPWYRNDGTAAFHIDTLPEGSSDIDDSTLQINAAVDIQPAQTREGYTFIGWARVVMDNPEIFEEESQYWTQNSLIVTDRNDLSGIDMLLYYNAENNKFYTTGEFTTEATKVAADEKPFYHAMFAVWEKKPVYLYVIKKDVTDNDTTYQAGAGFTLYKVGDEGADDTVIATLTSVATEEGIAFTRESELLDFSTLSDGAYKLEETTIPHGYGSDFNGVTFTILNGSITGDGFSQTIEDRGIINKYTVENYQIATVTITKVVESTPGWDTADQATGFTFTHDGETFILYGKADDETETEPAHETSKTFTVKLGTPFAVVETNNTEFSTTYSINGGESQAGSSVNIESITGDTSIAFTNTRKTVDITLKKTADDGTTPLSGAVFELTGTNPHVDQVTATMNESTFLFEDLASGTYVLTERKAPDGYVILVNSITFTINATGEGDVITLNSSVSDNTAETSGDNKDTVIVKNTAGTALPHTGGSGTLPYTLSGFVLILFTVMYSFRMRRGERRNE